MTYDEFLEAVANGDLDDQYADYLTNHTDLNVYNGDRLLELTESGVHDQAFYEWLTK